MNFAYIEVSLCMSYFSFRCKNEKTSFAIALQQYTWRLFSLEELNKKESGLFKAANRDTCKSLCGVTFVNLYPVATFLISISSMSLQK